MIISKKLLIVYIILFYNVTSFIDVGHLIINNITKQLLKPSTLQNINNLLMASPNDSDKEGKYIFETSSFYEKTNNSSEKEKKDYKLYKNWHHLDYKYSMKEGNKNVIDPNELIKNKNQAFWALNILLKSIKNKNNSDKKELSKKMLLLKLFLSILQDIHQPLHVVNMKFDDPERFDKKYDAIKEGDNGGRLFEFTYKFEIQENKQTKYINKVISLHRYLDSLAFQYEKIELPLDDEKNKKITEYANKIIAENKKDKNSTNNFLYKEISILKNCKVQIKELKNLNCLVFSWIFESINISRDVVYEGIEYLQPTEPSIEYENKIINMLKKQMYFASVRIALILELFFGDYKYHEYFKHYDITENQTDINSLLQTNKKILI